MKVAFVVGFFEPVKKTLSDFRDQIEGGSLVWIPQKYWCGEADLNKFSSHFYDRLHAGATEILVLLAVLRKKEWVEYHIQSMIEKGRQRSPKATIELIVERNAQNAGFVLEKISAFGLASVGEISTELLRTRLATGKVLCVHEDGRTGFKDALRRAGFPEETWEEFFCELTVSAGKNSNLIKVLKQRASQFSHLLYAWKGLRSLPPNIKQRYTGAACEAETTTMAVALFKKWLKG